MEQIALTILIKGILHKVLSSTKIRIHHDEPKVKKGENVKRFQIMYYIAVKTEPIREKK